MTLQYAFTFRYPKICSVDLRNQIEKLILDEFKLLSVDELIFFMMCNVNCQKIQLFDTIEKTVKARVNEIIQSAKERGPEILVNLFYAYTLCRIPRHRRKTRGIENNPIKEANQWFTMFDEPIRKDFGKLSTPAVYRLASALEMCSLKDVNELYWR
jgi:translation initiation factor RLI1